MAMELVPLRVALVAVLALAGCAAESPASDGSMLPGSPALTATSATSAAPSTGAAPPSGSLPPNGAVETVPPGVARTTGSATVTVDGVEHSMEVAMCGWSTGSRTLGETPGGRQLFYVLAARPVGSGFAYFELDWDGDVGYIEVTVLQADPTDPASAFRFANERQSSSLVAIEDLRATTVEPLTVYDGQDITTAAAHELEIDITCDGAGGVLGQGPDVLAAMFGITPDLDEGHVTVNGEGYPVEVTRCDRTGDAAELEARSAASGPVRLTLLVEPGFTWLSFSVEGRVLAVDGEVDIELTEDRIRTSTPIDGTIAGRGAAEVTLDLPCG